MGPPKRTDQETLRRLLDSGKLDAATELMEVIAEVGDAALIFSQYVAMGRLLHQHLVGRGIETACLRRTISRPRIGTP